MTSTPSLLGIHASTEKLQLIEFCIQIDASSGRQLKLKERVFPVPKQAQRTYEFLVKFLNSLVRSPQHCASNY